jgi:hypothetical protein
VLLTMALPLLHIHTAQSGLDSLPLLFFFARRR